MSPTATRWQRWGNIGFCHDRLYLTQKHTQDISIQIPQHSSSIPSLCPFSPILLFHQLLDTGISKQKQTKHNKKGWGKLRVGGGPPIQSTQPPLRPIPYPQGVWGQFWGSKKNCGSSASHENPTHLTAQGLGGGVQRTHTPSPPLPPPGSNVLNK